MLFEIVFDFRNYIDFLQKIGAYDVFLPFLLVFAIVFAVLEKTKVLGEKSNINVVVSFVIGLLLVAQSAVVEIINSFLPRVSLIIVVFLAFLLVISMIAGKEFHGLTSWGLGIAIIVAMILLVVALNPTWPEFLTSADRDSILQIALPLMGAFVVIWLITGKPKNKEENGLGKFLGSFDKSLRDK